MQPHPARVGVWLLLAASACDESGPRIYTARAYRFETGCLESFTAIARVEASELGASCEPVCLLLDDGLYVSTVCPPYPAEAARTDAVTSADCGVALELLAAEALCDLGPDSDAGVLDSAVLGETAGDAAVPSEAGVE